MLDGVSWVRNGQRDRGLDGTWSMGTCRGESLKAPRVPKLPLADTPDLEPPSLVRKVGTLQLKWGASCRRVHPFRDGTQWNIWSVRYCTRGTVEAETESSGQSRAEWERVFALSDIFRGRCCNTCSLLPLGHRIQITFLKMCRNCQRISPLNRASLERSSQSRSQTAFRWSDVVVR